MAAVVKLNAAKCPSCKIVLLRPVPGSTCQMLCPACDYHTSAQPAKQPRPHSLLPTVEVTDTSQDQVRFIGAFPGTANTTSGSSILGSNVSSPSFSYQGLYRRQDSRECQPADVVPLSPCSSSSDSSSPTQPTSWLPLPRVAAFPLGMGNIRRHSYQLIESQSASTPSRYNLQYNDNLPVYESALIGEYCETYLREQ